MDRLKGKVALISGGARGQGAAEARLFVGEGAKVVIGDVLDDQCRKTAADINARAGAKSVVPLHLDVTRAADWRAAVESCQSEFGGLDILVNNAGIAIVRGIDDLTESDFDQTIEVNLKSAFLCTQAVLPGMRAKKWGRIVNISSGAARGAGAIGVHYNASKAGMEGLTRGYAARLVKEGITVNAVAPSLIETDMMRGRSDLARNIPLGRLGHPDEVAQAVLMVLGNDYMTGQSIVLNGGMAFI
jgi:3-oxoacyl-[acyl-carrier protein] reductase